MFHKYVPQICSINMFHNLKIFYCDRYILRITDSDKYLAYSRPYVLLSIYILNSKHYYSINEYIVKTCINSCAIFVYSLTMLSYVPTPSFLRHVCPVHTFSSVCQGETTIMITMILIIITIKSMCFVPISYLQPSNIKSNVECLQYLW